MANSKQAIKRARQAVRNRICNRWQKSRMISHITRVMKSVTEGTQSEARLEYKIATSYIDKLVNKGIIHKNKAARHKSRLNNHIKTMAS